MKLLWLLLVVVLLMAFALTLKLGGAFNPPSAPSFQSQSPSVTTPSPTPIPQPQTPNNSSSTTRSTTIPTLSTSDTASLLKQVGKQVNVKGTVTHIEWTEPQSYPNETWTLVFFNASLQSDVPSSSRGHTSPWDYTSYFRLIIKPNVANSLSVQLLKGKTITVGGVIDLYLGAPVIYVDSATQVTVTDSTQSQPSPLKLTVVMPEKMYFEREIDKQLFIQNVSDSTVYSIVLYESGTQYLWKPTCGTAYQGGAAVYIGDLAPGKSTSLKCSPTLFAQYNLPIQPGQRVDIELSCDSSDCYDQYLGTITLTLEPFAKYFNVEINYDKPAWR